VDVDLSTRGVAQARRSGELLRAAGLLPTAAHSSVLTRAVRTAALALEAAGRGDVPTSRTWRLNERHYGALQGVDRRTARLEHGDTLFRLWRRSYDHRPPPIEPGSRWDVAADPRYAALDPRTVPRTESLRDVLDRLLPYWHEAVAPDLRAGHTVLVAAHGNSLRALVAHLDRLSDTEVLGLDIPTGMPLHYDLDPDLAPRVRGGAYLEPEAAAAAAAEVAAQGR
jgi:2,3-bisphosphoglycerate-dependent phosphoglycerate mutase